MAHFDTAALTQKERDAFKVLEGDLAQIRGIKARKQ
jgi:hypothetical protein